VYSLDELIEGLFECDRNFEKEDEWHWKCVPLSSLYDSSNSNNTLREAPSSSFTSRWKFIPPRYASSAIHVTLSSSLSLQLSLDSDQSYRSLFFLGSL
jgi:hypothetical protein